MSICLPDAFFSLCSLFLVCSGLRVFFSRVLWGRIVTPNRVNWRGNWGERQTGGRDCYLEKISLPRRTRRDTRRREVEVEGGAERNRSLMVPSPPRDWGLLMDIC